MTARQGTITSAEEDGDAPDNPGAARVILVTGMSGAGKTQALKAFEDMGFEAVDNVPLALLESLVAPNQRSFEGADFQKPLVIGVDIRTRDFHVDAILREVDRLAEAGEADVKLVFMDCDDDELRRRYAETRHRHPLAADRPVSDGIAHERRLMGPLRDRADIALDTTGLGPGSLKRILEGHFAAGSESSLAVFVTSFSFRRGLPREADLVFDVRFLANPHYVPELRKLTGRDQGVGDYIRRDEAHDPFFAGLTSLLLPLLPRYAAEGKSYLTIAVGCTGGRHRSVFIAERLTAWLRDQDQRVHLHHRELE